jgi:hypothetical protein
MSSPRWKLRDLVHRRRDAGVSPSPPVSRRIAISFVSLGVMHPQKAPVEQAYPLLRHVTTAFLRTLFCDDPAPVGLGPGLGDADEVGVTIEER